MNAAHRGHWPSGQGSHRSASTLHALVPSAILSAGGGIGLDPGQWPTVWFKGGSETGVLALGYLATNSKGQTFVVARMLSNPVPVGRARIAGDCPGAVGLVR